MVQNKGLIFKEAPEGWPVPGKHLTIETREIDLDQKLADGSFIAKNLYVSFDPYQRGRMRPAEVKSYMPAFPLNSVITNRGVSKVVASAAKDFSPGDLVVGSVGTEEYTIVNASNSSPVTTPHSKLQNPFKLDPKVYVGALGIAGLTAYAALYEIGKPKKGETIFVSSAAGAVGQIVGQIAKLEGLRVIGSVGSDQKLEFIVKDLGFDGGFNYKKEKPADALNRLAPDGLDIYFENVGGEQLEAAIDAMNKYGRIVACGMVSEYNTPKAERYPIRDLFQVVGKSLTIRGFLVADPGFGDKYGKEHHEKMGKWIADGSFKILDHVTDGIDGAPEGFVGMLEGRNFGKALVKIADVD